MPRRKSSTHTALEAALAHARTAQARAQAYYEPGVFHDRNSRETQAIPNYLAALKLGLDAKTKAQALAWLASSYYKTGQPKMALKYAITMERLPSVSPVVRRFIARLKHRLSL